MTSKFPFILGTLLLILAAGGTAVAQGEGNRFVSGSLNTLLAVNTVECEIRIVTLVEGNEYTARGNYEEQALPRPAPGQPMPFQRSMFRLEVRFSPVAGNAEPNRMTLVNCPATDREGSQVKRYTHVEGEKSFRVIDLSRLEERLRATNMELLFTQVSEVRNLGGLAGMMRQIDRFYEFSSPTQEILQEEETIPVWKLTGRLRSVRHRELLQQFGGLDKRGNYPADFPSDIELSLGRHDDFPYKIRYLRRPSEQSEQKVLLFQETFFNVVLNGTPIDSARFVLHPPDDVIGVDDTDRFIKELGL